MDDVLSIVFVGMFPTENRNRRNWFVSEDLEPLSKPNSTFLQLLQRK